MTPAERAKELLKIYCIDSPEKLVLEDIAFAENLIVDEEDLTNCLGKIQFKNDLALIKISSNISDPGQKKFTLAHEMGHYFNEKEIRNSIFYACTYKDINTYNFNKKFETDANEFASELLMPTSWFANATKRRPLNFELLKEVAAQFGTSLTATAIKYVKHGAYPAVLVLSKNGIVEWSFVNEAFPYSWLKKGYKVRKESSAFDYFAGKEMQLCDDIVPIHTWFSDDFNCPDVGELNEQNVAMPSYNSVLTILWEV
ncbi:MAG: ImmA/IrrE family metallo-endopeptidase [Melioribacteraceae bacterium]|nr:ImmA/IrrE family metallo-endopeptidase [Melioribacteraceae bacterium]